MTDSEEMAIRGRLMTDYADAKNKRTLLQAERERIGELINYVGNCITAYDPSGSSSFTDEHFAALDRAKILELVEDTRINNERLRNLAQKLKDLGLLES